MPPYMKLNPSAMSQTKLTSLASNPLGCADGASRGLQGGDGGGGGRLRGARRQRSHGWPRRRRHGVRAQGLKVVIAYERAHVPTDYGIINGSYSRD